MSSTTIRISRAKGIAKDSTIAYLKLKYTEHKIGQPVMVRYYVDEEETEISTLLAIGINDGIGEDCFEIVSSGNINVIRGVVIGSENIPDVSQLVHGEIYLYRDDSNIWNYVYEVSNVRQVEPITGGPYVFLNIEDRYRWFFENGKLKREDDFYTKEEIDLKLGDISGNFEDILRRLDEIEAKTKTHDDWLIELDKEVFPMSMTFSNLTGNIFLTGTTRDITFKVSVTRKEEDITEDCTYTLNGESIVLDSNNQYTKTGVSTTTTFNLIATHKTLGIKINKSLTVSFGYNFYYGIIPESGWTPNNETVTSLDNSKLQTKQNITYIMNLNQQKLAFACPKIYGKLSHIYDANNFDYVGDYEIIETQVEGFDYYIYVKTSSVTISNFRQAYTY